MIFIKWGSIISVLADDDILVTRLQDIFLLPRIITWLQAQWPSPHPLWPDLPPTGTVPPSHSLTPGGKGFHLLILMFFYHFLTFLYFREDRKFVDMFLRVTAASSVTSLVSLWSSFDTGLCDVLPLSHTGILCSTGLKCSTGPKHSRPPTAPAGIPSDIPESGLPRSNPLWAPWKHFCCQICRHGLLEVNVTKALIFKHLPLFQHQATVVAFSGTFHASDSAEMISPLNHKRLS